jgi:hypothetical protein
MENIRNHIPEGRLNDAVFRADMLSTPAVLIGAASHRGRLLWVKIDKTHCEPKISAFGRKTTENPIDRTADC